MGLEEEVESKLECVCVCVCVCVCARACVWVCTPCQAWQGGAEAWLGQATPEGSSLARADRAPPSFMGSCQMLY